VFPDASRFLALWLGCVGACRRTRGRIAQRILGRMGPPCRIKSWGVLRGAHSLCVVIHISELERGFEAGGKVRATAYKGFAESIPAFCIIVKEISKNHCYNYYYYQLSHLHTYRLVAICLTKVT